MAKGPEIKEVTLAQVQTIAHHLAQELMEWGEPIPAFHTRYPDRLESCLKSPFQRFGGKSLYRGLIGKGAAIFYFMIKDHPFQNGNKRVAIMTLLYFLYKNGWWLEVSNDIFYEFAYSVADSEPNDKEKEFRKIRIFIRRYLTRPSAM